MEVSLVVEVGSHTSYWKQRVRLSLDVAIIELKRQMETTINIPAENQAWFYKDEEIRDSSRLSDIEISSINNIIVVKRKALSYD